MQIRLLDGAILAVGLMMVAYQMVSTQYLFLGSYEHQAVHLGFIFVLLFLNQARNARGAFGTICNIGLAVLGVVAAGYVFVNIVHLEEVFGYPEGIDVVVGVLLIALVVIATRATWGWTLPIVSAIFVGYFLWGHLIPGHLHHRPFNFDYVVSYLSIGLSGIFGTFLGISANQVFLFVVFGSLLGIIKVNDFFLEAGKIAGKAFRGGPGQTAVVSSGFIGMISGAAVANVAVTGAFTIPYMKQVGYKPEHAGAIEATASTGGQLMPPVMGAAAFLMASFLGVSYDAVMLAGILPAILYFWGVMLGVQFLAVRCDIRPPLERINYRVLLRRLPLFALPLAVLVTMLILQYSPANAAFWAIILAVALSYVDPQTRPKYPHLCRSLTSGAIIGAQIGISLAIVGLVAQTLITTGLGNKIASLVELLSGGNLLIGLLLTMVVSIILGCGVPTSAAYTLVAIVVIPSVIKMGVDPMAAHFFSFYFAVISSLTPPVALAALAGAGLAGAPYFKTSLSAAKLAISGFIIPFLIIFNPLLTFNPVSWAWGIGTIVAVPLGMTALTAAIYGCGLTMFTARERLLAAVSAFCLLGYSVFRHVDELPIEYPMLVIGCVVFAWVLISQIRANQESGKAMRPEFQNT
ncbi:TRAP transporter, 4TM/12TM fusion protein [Nitratireductor indicus C115]|uniref:TRAP transporter, 4TM/12TM fusion protein n=1 Tax=Nitratireductor indicus C115 TaxID=1231190 RepID=K2PL27_9HYPH|nr:TRAP transporter fused permease subunit [Nitratireductor indicus]EKF41847.1 TRAP transporter, 4TM/12TM fusion protein [Nitratireductor indicus C115]SFQ66700.1 TRAP transporter, 4TM/12TM fusion protein [Nitratireductor indicus]